jgi:hypothetical protein
LGVINNAGSLYEGTTAILSRIKMGSGTYGPSLRVVQPNGSYSDSQSLQICTSLGNSDSTETPRITIMTGAGGANGNIGIGTTSPQGPLQIQGSSLWFGTFNNAGTPAVPYQSEASRNNINFAGYRDVANNRIGAKICGVNRVSLDGANVQTTDLTFQTTPDLVYGQDDSVERMVIKGNGNVGIGTTSPISSTRLDVRSAGDGVTITNWIAGAFGSSGEKNRVVMGTYSDNAIVGAHNNALASWTTLVLNPGGAVRLGFYTTDGGLSVTDGNGTITTTVSDRRLKENIVYQTDTAEGLFRRGMYTFWKRTCPPPSMVSFDAPNREVCVARRSRTNTPTQALVLLNDPTYVEAARVFASDILRTGGADDLMRLNYAYRKAIARQVLPEEIPPLKDLLDLAKSEFLQDPQRTTAFLSVGTLPPASELNPSELAAWTVVCSAILNLDETITKY